MNFENMEDIIQALNKDKETPDEYETFGDIVREVVSMGNTDKVLTFNDEFLGLEDDLGNNFLNLKINNDNIKDNEYKVDQIIEVSSDVISLFKRELTESMIDDIKEDKILRGESPDNLDYSVS